MRRNRIAISITRFGQDVPKGYPNKDRMNVHIYADSNNLYAALSKAYAKAINVMEEWERVGSACEISTNADSSGGFIINNMGLRYDENWELDYSAKKLEYNKRLLGYIENSTAILDVIKSSDREHVRQELHDKLGYSLEETSNILRVNFNMMTADHIKELEEETARLEEYFRKKSEQP